MRQIVCNATSAKLCAAAVLVAGLLAAPSARADLFQVNVTGSFTQAVESPPVISPGTSFSFMFDVNTTTVPVSHQTSGGLTVSGYANADISNFSIVVGGVKFTQSNISDQLFFSGAPFEAVIFSQDLSAGATPSIWMTLDSGLNELRVGEVAPFSGGSQFINLLSFTNDSASDSGSISGVSVTAVTPTTPLPATLPLFATGLGALGLLGWRRKRKARASVN